MSDIRLRHNQDEQSEAFLCKDINGAESYLHWMVGDKHVNPLVQQDRADLLDCIAELEETNRAYKEAWSVNILTERIDQLEPFCERFVNAYPDWRDEYEALGEAK